MHTRLILILAGLVSAVAIAGWAPAAMAATAAPTAAPSAAHSAAPSRAQVSTAVARAERSPNLWATVNICNTKKHPNVVGIRAQMPALGFRSLLSMVVQLRYWSDTEKRYKPVPGTRQTITLGTERSGLHQSGVSFRFSPHAGTLTGTVAFQWRLNRRSIGRVLKHTSPNHPDADQSDPAHFSAGKCEIS